MRNLILNKLMLSLEEETDNEKTPVLLLEVDKYIYDSHNNPPEELYDKLYDHYKETGVDLTENEKKQIEEEDEADNDKENIEATTSENDNNDLSDSETSEEETSDSDEEDKSNTDIKDPTVKESSKDKEENKEEDKNVDDVGLEDKSDLQHTLKQKSNETKEEKALESFKYEHQLTHLILSNFNLVQESIAGWITDKGFDVADNINEKISSTLKGSGDSLLDFGVDKGALIFNMGKTGISTAAVTTLGVLSVTGRAFLNTVATVVSFVEDKLKDYTQQQKKINKLKADIERLASIKLETEIEYNKDYTLSSIITSQIQDPIKAVSVVKDYANELFSSGLNNYKSNVFYIKRINEKVSSDKTNMDDIKFHIYTPLSKMKQQENEDDISIYKWPSLLPGDISVLAYIPNQDISLSNINELNSAHIVLSVNNNIIKFNKIHNLPSIDYLNKLIHEVDSLNKQLLAQKNFVSEMKNISKQGKSTLIDMFNRVLYIENQLDRKHLSIALEQYMKAVENTNLSLFIKSHTYFENYLTHVLKYINDCVKIIAKHYKEDKS